MTATIQRWGDSLALRLPKLLAEAADLTEGHEVELVQTADGLLLKSKSTIRFKLDDLLAGVTPDNVHPESD